MSRAATVAVVGGLAVSGAIAVGGGLAAASPASVSAGVNPQVINILRSLPNTHATRGFISYDDLTAIWATSGLTSPPTVKQLNTDHAVSAASGEIYDRNALNDTLWYPVFHHHPRPLGYSPLDLTSEMSVSGDTAFGEPSSGIDEAWGPISARSVLTAIADRPKVTHSEIPSGTLLNLSKAVNFVNARYPFNYFTVPYLAVPASGGRLADGSTASLTRDVADSRPVHRSLWSDPNIRSIVTVLGTDTISFDAMNWKETFSGVLRDIYGKHPGRQGRKLAAAVGIKRLTAGPVMMGIAHVSGGPRTEKLIAAAVYPSHAAAQSAVGTVARYTADGTDQIWNKKNSRFWTVTGTAVKGRTLVMTLTTGHPDQLMQSVDELDFPLFWAP